MALRDPYISAEDFLARTGTAVGDGNTAQIETLVRAASRRVDGWTGRQFNKSETAEERLYTGVPPAVGYSPWAYANRGYSVLTIDEFVSIDAVATDNGSGEFASGWVADTDYAPTPDWAPTKGTPYTGLVAIGSKPWPYGRNWIRVRGVFGWAEVPDDIKEATFMIANRLKGTWTAPFGIAGSAELGNVVASTNLTPIIKEMLAPYRVLTV